MKQLSSDAYSAYGRFLRAARAKGRKLGFPELGAAAEIALELEEAEPDREKVERLAAALGLDVADVDGLQAPSEGQAPAPASKVASEVAE
jgi:hypothetical protein